MKVLIGCLLLAAVGCSERGVDILAPSRQNPIDRRTGWAQEPIVCWYCEAPTFYTYTDAEGILRTVTVCQDWQPRPPSHCALGEYVTTYTPKP